MGLQINFAHVNAQADFPAILTHYGLEFTQKGRQIRLICPFHDDTNPSLSVTLEDTDQAMANTFHCFGCKAKGSPIDFVKLKDGLEVREAATKAAEISGCALAPGRSANPKTRKPAKNAPGGRQTASELPEGGKAGKSAPEASQPATGANKPLTFTLTLDIEHEDVLRRLDVEAAKYFGVGVLDTTSKGMMAGRICIPIHNATGELVAYAGRWPSEVVPQGEDKYLFPPKFAKMTELFNLHRLGKAAHIVIVEGFFSAMRLHQLGVPVVALMGTAISAEQVTLLKQHGVKSALVLLDGDEAGQIGSEAVGKVLVRSLFARVVQLPEGSSPDDLDETALAAVLPFPVRNQF